MAAYLEAVILSLSNTLNNQVGRAASATLNLSTSENKGTGYELPVELTLANTQTTGLSYGLHLDHTLATLTSMQANAAYHELLQVLLKASPAHKLGQNASITFILEQAHDILIGQGSQLSLLLAQQAAMTLGHGTQINWSVLLGGNAGKGQSAVQTLVFGITHPVDIGRNQLLEYALQCSEAVTPKYVANPEVTVNVSITDVPQAQAGLHTCCTHLVQVNYTAMAGNECIGWLHRDGATWEYTGLDVTGLTVMNNTLIISNRGGIYRLSGNADVEASLDTGDTDLATQQHKRLPQVWIDRGKPGVDYIEVINEDTAYRYPLESNLRYRIGRGLESVYWRMKFVFKQRAAFSKLLLYPLVLARNLIRGGNDPREP